LRFTTKNGYSKINFPLDLFQRIPILIVTVKEVQGIRKAGLNRLE
jgi:hypothetical protein